MRPLTRERRSSPPAREEPLEVVGRDGVERAPFVLASVLREVLPERDVDGRGFLAREARIGHVRDDADDLARLRLGHGAVAGGADRDPDRLPERVLALDPAPLTSEAQRQLESAKAQPALSEYAGRLEKASGDLQASTMWLMQNGIANPDNAGAGSTPYLHLMGIVSLGLMWLRMASAAQAALDAGTEDKAFMEAKLVTARFFAERIMPDTGALRRKLEAGAEAIMALPVEAF